MASTFRIDDHVELGRAPDVGTVVQVRSRFDERWTDGFVVAVADHDVVQLRRLSDGSLLPAWFPVSMVRVADDVSTSTP